MNALERQQLREAIDQAQRRRESHAEHGPGKWMGIEVDPKRVGSCEAAARYGMDYTCGEPTVPGERFCGRHRTTKRPEGR